MYKKSELSKKYFFCCPRLVCFDNETKDADPKDADPNDADPKDTDPKDTDPKDTDFKGLNPEAQKKVQAIITKEKQKYEAQTNKTIKELEALKQKSNITTQQRAELQQRIESLQNDLLSKDELAKKERTNAEKKHQTEVKTLSDDRDKWKDLYSTTQIQSELTNAALIPDQEAFSPKQIVQILKPNAELEDEFNEKGEKTGKYVVKVTMDVKNEKDEIVSMKLAPKEAVKLMFDNPEYANLFKDKSKAGIGGKGNDTGGVNSVAELAKTNIDKYVEGRRKGTLKLS